MVVGIDWIKECLYDFNDIVEELQAYLINECGFAQEEAYAEAKRRVICPDYGNGTVDAIWKVIKQNKPVYTTGKYIVGNFVKSVPKLIQVA